MRSDMAKILVERPRFGSRNASRKKGYRKYLAATPIEEQQQREPMLGHWRGKGKWFNENLSPLHRFLRSSIGRPWNKVYQQLREHVNFDNVVQKHLLTHVYQFVEKNVEVRGESVYSREHAWLYRRPLSAGQMFVCPRTGLLRVVKSVRRQEAPKQLNRSQPLQYHRVGDSWFELRLQSLPTVAVEQWDVHFERRLTGISIAQLNQVYGGKLYAISKHSLSPGECRELYRQMRKNRNSEVILLP